MHIIPTLSYYTPPDIYYIKDCLSPTAARLAYLHKDTHFGM